MVGVEILEPPSRGGAADAEGLERPLHPDDHLPWLRAHIIEPAEGEDLLLKAGSAGFVASFERRLELDEQPRGDVRAAADTAVATEGVGLREHLFRADEERPVGARVTDDAGVGDKRVEIAAGVLEADDPLAVGEAADELRPEDDLHHLRHVVEKERQREARLCEEAREIGNALRAKELADRDAAFEEASRHSDMDAFADACGQMTREDWDADNDWLASAGWGEM